MKSKVIYFIVVVFVVFGSIVVGWAVGVIIKEDIKPYPNINQTLSNTTEMEDYLLLSYSFNDDVDISSIVISDSTDSLIKY